MATKAQLQADLTEVRAAISRQRTGLARHGRDDRFYQEADLKVLLENEKTLERKLSRSGRLPSDVGGWQ